MKTAYLQYTTGWDGEKLVAPNLAYTTATNVEAFIASGIPNGTVGIFNATTGALISTAIAADTEFFIAIKRDGLMDKSTVLKKDANLRTTKTVGVAGNAQVSTVIVTCGGTSDCLNCNCCTSKLTDYSISIIDPGTNDFVLESWDYYLTGKDNKKIPDLLAALRTTQINDGNSPQNRVRNGQIVNMSAITEALGNGTTPNTYTFTVTGLNNKPFKLAIKGFCNVSVTLTTPASEGINPLFDVQQAEREQLILETFTYANAPEPFTAVELGQPTSFAGVTAATLFTSYDFKYRRVEPSFVVEQHVRHHNVLFDVPTGTALETSLNTIFGV